MIDMYDTVVYVTHMYDMYDTVVYMTHMYDTVVYIS